MLQSIANLKGFKALTSDGQVGKVVDFILDTDDMAVRYLVVDTGNLFAERDRYVLVSTCAIGEPDLATKTLPLSCTKEQVRTSPDLNLENPITHDQMEELHKHYDWEIFWSGYGQAVSPARTGHLPAEKADQKEESAPEDRFIWHGYGYPVGHLVSDVAPEKKK